MAKKQKVELTPEEKAAKKAHTFKRLGTFLGNSSSSCCTAGIYGLASKTASKETAATGTGNSRTERLAECRRQRVQIRLGYKRKRQRFFAVGF